jgi:formylglycine-generating enzyme required for sulfatase activity
VIFSDIKFRASCGADGKGGINGGVWEWTSTVFDTHAGFEPTEIFPGCVSFDLNCI